MAAVSCVTVARPVRAPKAAYDYAKETWTVDPDLRKAG
jgi:hypothetical protein